MGSISHQTRHLDVRRRYDDNCCLKVKFLPPNTSEMEIKALFQEFLFREDTEVNVRLCTFKTKGDCALVVFPTAEESMNTAVSLPIMKPLEIRGCRLVVSALFDLPPPLPVPAKNINIATLMNLSPETLMEEIRDACNCFVPEGDNIDIIFYRQHTKNSGRHNSYACLRFSSVAVCEHAMGLSSTQRHTAVLGCVNTKILLKPIYVHQVGKLEDEMTKWNVRVAKDLPNRCFDEEKERKIRALTVANGQKL